MHFLFHVVWLEASTHSFGEGSVLVTIRNIQCRGSESSLAECVYTTSQNTCSRDEHGIIGVQCAPGKKKLLTFDWIMYTNQSLYMHMESQKIFSKMANCA